MSQRILFVIPPALGSLAANHEGSAGMGALTPEQGVYAYPPHTVAQCAAAARAAGWTVAVLDGAEASSRHPERSVSQPEDFPPEDAQLQVACGPQIEARGAGTPLTLARASTQIRASVIAVLAAAGTADADATFLRILRQQRRGLAAQPPILLFGPSAGLVARDWIAEGLADALLTGEPDAAIALAFDAVLRGARGLLAAADLAPNAYTPAGLLTDLDALPFPAWDLVPWQPYGMVSLLSGRGCPAGCGYCAYTLAQGAVFRSQSVERTLAEWAQIAEQVRPPYLVVRDPVFAHDRNRVMTLCAELSRRGLKVGWACESRPEHFDRDLIRQLAAAGCATIKIGMESGDANLLARIGRVARPEDAAAYLDQVARVAEWCREAGVRCRIFTMAGLPGESPATVEATIAALRRVAPTATLHPNVYRAYDGVTLAGPNQPVARATLQAIREANRPQPPLLKRALVAARHKLQSNPTQPRSSETSEVKNRIPAVFQEKLREQQYLLAGSRVLLTGGSGFLGGHVARALVAAGAEVLALLRPDATSGERPPGALADLPLQLIRGDLAQPLTWARALQGCRFCFHVAALYAGAEHAAAMYEVNVRATGRLLAACAEAGVARFVHTGTIGTVGRPAHGQPAPDESVAFNLWEQASHYARSKWLGELVAQTWNGAGLDVVIVKPTAPVGAGDGTAHRPPSATGRRIRAALQGQPFAYPAGGINHAPVRDVAAGHLLAAERGQAGAAYILGHAHGNLDRAAFLRLLNAPQVANARVSDAAALTADPGRAIRELGLPQSDLAAAFAEAAAWQRALVEREARGHVVAG